MDNNDTSNGIEMSVGSTLDNIEKEWDEIQSTHRYKLLRKMGQGSFGTVYET